MKKEPKLPGALPFSDDGSAATMNSSEREDSYFWKLGLKPVRNLPEKKKDFAVK